MKLNSPYGSGLKDIQIIDADTHVVLGEDKLVYCGASERIDLFVPNMIDGGYCRDGDRLFIYGYSEQALSFQDVRTTNIFNVDLSGVSKIMSVFISDRFFVLVVINKGPVPSSISIRLFNLETGANDVLASQQAVSVLSQNISQAHGRSGRFGKLINVEAFDTFFASIYLNDHLMIVGMQAGKHYQFVPFKYNDFFVKVGTKIMSYSDGKAGYIIFDTIDKSYAYSDSGLPAIKKIRYGHDVVVVLSTNNHFYYYSQQASVWMPGSSLPVSTSIVSFDICDANTVSVLTGEGHFSTVKLVGTPPTSVSAPSSPPRRHSVARELRSLPATPVRRTAPPVPSSPAARIMAPDDARVSRTVDREALPLVDPSSSGYGWLFF
tara:strand:- start:3814 stop:4947 length:1134 start_codon:yes stop_codon:yes gene_type:complete